MADPSAFKLFRTVDPSTVNVPIKEKFAKLTLSSNKQKQLEKVKEKDKEKAESKSIERKSYEHPLLRSDSSSSVVVVMGLEDSTPKSLHLDDVSDYMEALQLSGDGCTQRTLDADVEQLSTEVSNLTMQPKAKQQPQQEISICITTTTEDEDENSCITISDTSDSECDPAQGRNDERQEQVEVEESMAVSEQPAGELLGLPLTTDKAERIEAFLRDVSFERRRGFADISTDQLHHSRLASADTESMSQDIDCTQLPSSPAFHSTKRPLDSSKLLADDETVVNTVCSEELLEADQEPEPDSSKRLAANDTEVNTMCSEEQLEQKSSKRLAANDTEVNTPESLDESLAELSGQHSTLNDVDPNESITIPETCSEAEQSPARPSSATSTGTGETETEAVTPAIQVSSINISAKINIKIHIPNMDSSSAESDADADPDADANDNYVESDKQEQQRQQQQQQEKERSMLKEDASEDEQFLTNAEQLLNQLYGRSWQTPDVIRTLKRSSGSGGKVAAPAPTPTVDRTPLTEIRRQPRSRRGAATTAKKRIPRDTPNESGLGDFSLFKRALHSTKLNSTHLPTAARTEKAASKQRVRTNHVHEDRWRALVDSDSGEDASDDEDADATNSDSSEENHQDDGHVTYLDLTKPEVEVVSSPDDATEKKSPGFPKKLDDILRTCRATVKPKLCATPVTPITTNPTRRQLFTPITGYEDDKEAKMIVEQALDLDSLDQLENVYMPGTNVHKRVQEVRKQLGIATESPKPKPNFKMPTPKATPIAKSMERNKKVETPKLDRNRKCSFIKSLDSNIGREYCDNEAYFFRENFNRNKEDLAKRLYSIYNAEVFDNKLDVPITWSKLLRNTAGRCKNKRRLNVRNSVVELSVKVLTSADRLRCTLIHELCHAAAWIFNGEGGHGRTWKMWAQRAMNALPDLPPIERCHNYAIEFKYTYRCNTCNVESHSHTRSRKVEDLRCRRCSGPITLQLNKKDKQGNVVATPVREATGFAKYVKDNFKKHKRDNLTAAQVMRILSVEYAKEKNADQNSNKEAAESQTAIANRVEALLVID
ncbi:acidic repeat-containing protein [Drosophila innubila]|uniref:acidic repeat-containing protein n=1 Tax=Drosophila innubila TaxID=198719 RepID=UPI00148DCFCD|nr:acidic repeat-containing protein [Drosophila innubila]